MWSINRQESVRPRGSNAVAAILRVTLKLANTVLALCGLAIMVYATYMFGEIHRRPSAAPAFPPPAPALPPGPPPPLAHEDLLANLLERAHAPWFIYAFFGAGLFTFITAATGLIGAHRNSRAWLGLYAFLAIVLLLAQGVVALAFFADAEWQKRLPHDETGEARRLRRWIEKRMDVCKWVGLAVLLLQVISVAVAFGLSAAQQRALEDSDEDDEAWGRRQPLLAQGAAFSAASREDAEAPALPTPEKHDPWSQRMRDKYGLDTSQFTYAPPSPEGAASPLQPAPAAGAQQQETATSRCVIM